MPSLYKDETLLCLSGRHCSARQAPQMLITSLSISESVFLAYLHIPITRAEWGTRPTYKSRSSSRSKWAFAALWRFNRRRQASIDRFAFCFAIYRWGFVTAWDLLLSSNLYTNWLPSSVCFIHSWMDWASRYRSLIATTTTKAIWRTYEWKIDGGR